MAASSLIVASNRGPAKFRRSLEGALELERGAGGLAPSLAGALRGSGAVWVAAALSPLEAELARAGSAGLELDGIVLHLLDMGGEVHDAAYRVIANGTLWFLYHGLFDLARQPRFDNAWYAAWERFREFNAGFAAAIADAAAPEATVLVHDYHLPLVGAMLASTRPDLKTVHFTHTPFCDPFELAVLPPRITAELLAGMMAYGACGFHTQRWAAAFEACCDTFAVGSGPEPRARRTEEPGSVPSGSDRGGRGRPVVFSSPLAPDRTSLEAMSRSVECERKGAALEESLDGRMLILRSDRLELSKNLLRGFAAFDELLAEHRELVGRVVFRALCYPSREDVPGYAAYRVEVEQAVAELCERYGSTGYEPAVLEVADDFPASVAALQRSDVLLVNPIRDGLNLVAKEGVLANTVSGSLALSREAGAFEELGAHCLPVAPFDVSATASVLYRGLVMDRDERDRRALELRKILLQRSPASWLADLLAAAERL